MIETVQLEHVPSTHRVYASFFKDVSNADFLQSQLLARNSEFEYAFIDASSVGNRPAPILRPVRIPPKFKP